MGNKRENADPQVRQDENKTEKNPRSECPAMTGDCHAELPLSIPLIACTHGHYCKVSHVVPYRSLVTEAREHEP